MMQLITINPDNDNNCDIIVQRSSQGLAWRIRRLSCDGELSWRDTLVTKSAADALAAWLKSIPPAEEQVTFAGRPFSLSAISDYQLRIGFTVKSVDAEVCAPTEYFTRTEIDRLAAYIDGWHCPEQERSSNATPAFGL